MNKKSFNEINAVISGGNKGIGLAVAKSLLNAGARVFSLGRSEFAAFHQNFTHISCDITNFSRTKAVIDEIKSRYELNMLVNNAGLADFCNFASSNSESNYNMVNLNLSSAISLTHNLLGDMLKNQFGIIVNISSIAAIENFADCSVYNATKAGLLSFSRSLRKEVRGKGIKILDFLPGATLTDIWDKDFAASYGSKMMLPEEIAEIIFENIKLSLNPRLMIEEVIITPQAGSL
ncbi:MAG: SDR family oxidoreductase [Candidatus Kapabacteria bacterium]|nr:SDR family oxidoreductase [Ignavibacteriota bacterium]MCW5883970.1 SDR family oxidoreductase [Candidatus Kapabacteria bacterium]